MSGSLHPATYAELKLELSGLLTEDWLSNLSNFSATIFNSVPDLNWCGFYLVRQATGPEHLKLGPFQGLPACLDIPFSRGVCGAAASARRTLRVDDVHTFADHIACDSRSRSELVVPLIDDEGRLIGVFDVDSPRIARFNQDDETAIQQLVSILMEKTSWPKDL